MKFCMQFKVEVVEVVEVVDNKFSSKIIDKKFHIQLMSDFLKSCDLKLDT